MPLPIGVGKLLEQQIVESSRIDYKEGWNPESIIHTICAFANDIDNIGGGYIVIGVEEQNGKPIIPVKGLLRDSIDDINKDIVNKCNLIEPRYVPVVSHEIYEGKDILVLWVPGGDARPYKCPVGIYKNAKTDKAYYIRKASNTIKANASEEKQLFSVSENIPFDDRVNNQAELEDIDPYLVSGFLNNVGSSLAKTFKNNLEEIALQMGIVGGPAEYRLPKNIALMFFNQSPDRFFPYAQIDFVDKPNPSGENMTEAVFKGPLDKQLTSALQFIRGYVIKERIMKLDTQAEAIRFFNFPYAAIEEALVNAVYHKSYEIREPITVTLTPDCLEIKSFPGPDRYITDDDLQNGHIVGQRYRNRRIGDYLKELRLAEGRNTGIAKIISAMESNGSPFPVFISDNERCHFSVVLPIHPGFAPEKEENGRRRSDAELRNDVLSLLADEGKLSVSELSSKLGYQMPPSSLRAVIKNLMAQGRIEYTESSKRAPNQKIRLRI